MSNKYSYVQRQHLKQLVIESEVLGLGLNRAREYILSKSGLDISIEYVSAIKRIIKQDAPKRLQQLQHSRYAYLYQYFKRIDEIGKYQQRLWETINANEDDGHLTKSCISELHQLTITLANLYEMLPEYSASLAANPQTTTENSSEQSESQTQRVFA